MQHSPRVGSGERTFERLQLPLGAGSIVQGRIGLQAMTANYHAGANGSLLPVPLASKQGAGSWLSSIGLHAVLLTALALLHTPGGKRARERSPGTSGIVLDTRIGTARSDFFVDADGAFASANGFQWFFIPLGAAKWREPRLHRCLAASRSAP